MKMSSQNKWVYTLTVLAISACVLLPFLVFGREFESYILTNLADIDTGTIFLLVILFLAVDILLPVPSSIVSVWGGYSLGVIGDTVSIFLGMSLSCMVGYVIGKYGSYAFSRRYLNAMSAANDRFGVANMIILRGVPVLAEATVVAMGVGRYPFKYFLVYSLLANLGIAILYASMGHLGQLIDSIFFVIAAGVVIPLLLACALFARSFLGTRSPADVD